MFGQGIKSYKDLPMYLAEFGKVNRYEAAGGLSGLLRVREFTQDDAHIFCTEEQLEEEVVKILRFIKDIYAKFGFTNISMKLATRKESEFRIGSDEIWDKAEGALKHALDANGIEYEIAPGDAAFYGPKIDNYLKDALGRTWQCGTGSIERFMGILLGSTGGNLPLWLSPEPVVVAPISEKFRDYALEIVDRLRDAGVWARADLRDEKVNYKIRELSLAKTPIIGVVGEKEMADNTITLRKLGVEKQETIALDKFIADMKDAVKMPA